FRPDVLMDAERIKALLVELGERLAERGIEARMFVVGGAAMALGFSRTRVTRDIDAIFEPKTSIYSEATKMAEEHHLPPDWLNDGVKGLVPDRRDQEVGTEFTTRGIAVQIAGARYLFAMKSMAARAEGDLEDLRVLAAELGMTSVDAAIDLVEEYYGPERIPPRTRYVLEEALAAPPT
ncbi:MAG: nucleotidyl transferase, partial [Actinomycetota bacterium]